MAKHHRAIFVRCYCTVGNTRSYTLIGLQRRLTTKSMSREAIVALAPRRMSKRVSKQGATSAHATKHVLYIFPNLELPHA